MVAIDSTGLSLYSYSDWHNLKHKEQSTRNIDRWRKLHIVIDVKTGEILSALLTNSREHDCRHLPRLLNEIEDDINNSNQENAYGRKKLATIKDHSLKPPCIKSKPIWEIDLLIKRKN